MADGYLHTGSVYAPMNIKRMKTIKGSSRLEGTVEPWLTAIAKNHDHHIADLEHVTRHVNHA